MARWRQAIQLLDALELKIDDVSKEKSKKFDILSDKVNDII